VYDERTASGRGANDAVIATNIGRGWETIKRMINLYDQRNMQLGEGPLQKLSWQRVIRQGGIILTGEFNPNPI